MRPAFPRNAFRTGTAPDYRRQMSRPIAWMLFAVAIALAAAGGALILLSLGAPMPDQWGFRGYNDIFGPIAATTGLLIALRQRGNPIGWLLLLAGLASGVLGFGQEYATYAVLFYPGSLPAAVPVAWLCSWVFGFQVAPVLMLIPQLVPTGRALTRRWTPLLWLGWWFVPACFLVFGLRPGPLENASFVDNPVVPPPPVADILIAITPVLYLLIAASALSSGLSLVLRFRRSHGVERQQLKWIALSGAFVAAAFTLLLATTPTTSTSTFKPAQILMIAALMTLPLAFAIAMLRYRLYDVDLIINRTIVYGALSAALAAAYFALVVLFQAVLRPLTGGSEISVAASTLGTIALFQPLRHATQRTVDHRFYRARYDAQNVVDTFTSRLRDEVDLDDVQTQLLAAVHATVRPRGAGLWLRGRGT